MRIRRSVAGGAAFALLTACGGAEEPTPAEPVVVKPLDGMYEVSGSTVEKATGSERGLSGRVIVKTEGDSYTTSFELSTTLVGSGEPQRATIRGEGEGAVEGRKLNGSAKTQMIIALVPGVDAGFAMMPRFATTRLVNSSTATIAPDGSVHIEIESTPAPGETNYAPTRTTLRGHRLGAAGIGGGE
jgi:hypothetical protein